MQFVEYSSLVLRLAVFQNPLDDSASIWVGSKDVNLAPEGFDDELNVLCWYSFDSFLHDVIAILIFDTLENIRLELCDEFCLLVCKDMFECLYRSLAYA